MKLFVLYFSFLFFQIQCLSLCLISVYYRQRSKVIEKFHATHYPVLQMHCQQLHISCQKPTDLILCRHCTANHESKSCSHKGKLLSIQSITLVTFIYKDVV